MLVTIDKPTWYTSFAIIRKLKKLFPDTKIWHSGTLDPLATWILVIWTWKHTKLLQWIQAMGKTYEAEIDFSMMSDTWDVDYYDFLRHYDLIDSAWKKVLIVDWKEIFQPTLEELESHLQRLVGVVEMPLPSFSAKKVGGKKLYDLARDGKDLKLQVTMKINKITILSYDFPKLRIFVDVGSGTYIRSIAYWLGQQLWTWGILTALRRNSVWPFKL